MIGYLVGRLVQAIPVLFLASIAVFLVLRLVPGDPADNIAGEDASPAQVAAIREQLGLNDPLPVQYGRWIGDLAQGDLGVSVRTGVPVRRLLSLSLPPTLELAVASYVIAILIGLPLGVIAGVKPRSGWDWLLSSYTVGTLGVPNFMLGVLLLWLFSVKLGWLPVSGRISFFDDPVGSIRYLVLPAFALGTGLGAVLARYTRTTVQAAMGQDYIRTARAKGLASHVVVIRHALRNSLIPVITNSATNFGVLLVGATVTEAIFNVPGVGNTLFQATLRHEGPTIVSFVTVFVIIYVLVNLAVDLLYGLLDPRIRYAK